jgi:hypothetical protein
LHFRQLLIKTAPLKQMIKIKELDCFQPLTISINDVNLQNKSLRVKTFAE